MALVVTLTVIVALLGMLVAGLLRSHADILRSLHALGAGVGDPAAPAAPANSRSGDQPRPVTIGPPLPPERRSTSAFPVAGVTPSGDALVVAVKGVDQFTLLGFLSSGCGSCARFWDALRSPKGNGLPDGVRPIIVTKGGELEEPAQLAALAGDGLPVVMSTQAWVDYEIPGSPFFVLVDGDGRRIGEGMAAHMHQVADLVHRAMSDAGLRGPATGRRAVHVDGPGRESENDDALVRAGILPGDPSLYPRTIQDVFGGATAGSTDARHSEDL